MQPAGFGSLQTPPMHSAGPTQSGPLAVSQAAPSAAGARHVPENDVPLVLHLPPPEQATMLPLTKPQGAPGSGLHAAGELRVNSASQVTELKLEAQLSSLDGVADELGAISDGRHPSLARASHVATSPYAVAISAGAQVWSSVHTDVARSVHALSALTLPQPAARRSKSMPRFRIRAS